MGFILEIIRDIWQIFLDLIGFIFDIDFKDEEEDNPFSNIEDPNAENSSEKTTNPKRVFETREVQRLEAAFGAAAADFIINMRNEVDEVVKAHGLEYQDSILTVIPPEKLGKSDIHPAVINTMIESIYAQFDGDVILRPGKVNVFMTDEGMRFAEMYIDCYKPVEEPVNSL